MDLIARGLAAKTRTDALGGANGQALKAAVRTLGCYPRALASLAANDQPTVTLGTANANSVINNASTTAPLVARADARLTYVSGVPVQAGTTFPRTFFYNSRGGYYGAGDAGGTTEVRGSAYFAYEFNHTGSQFDVPVYGAMGNAGVNFRVLVNGALAGTVSVPNATGSVYYVKVAFPASGTRRIRIETAGMPCNGVNVASSSEVASVGRDYPLAVVIGDSFVEGSGGDVGDFEAVVTARALGFSAALAGVGSTGIINPGNTNTSGFPKVAWTDPKRLLDLTLAGATSAQTGAAADPAIGLVFMSINDQGLAAGVWGAFGATLTDAIENRCNVLIDAWLAARSGKPLVLFGPTWANGTPTLDVYRVRDGAQRAAWARFGANVWFIDRLLPGYRIGVWSNVADQASLYTGSDGTHPTPAGHRFDGLNDAAALRRLILSEMA